MSSAFPNSGFTESSDFSALLHRKIGPFLFGFGKKELAMETLAAKYPSFAWEHLKQIHSAKIVESFKPSDPRSSVGAYATVEADAHFSSVPNLALVVKSADCVPILIACASNEKPPAVCAIHAGWRGVNTDIVQNSVRALLERGYAPSKMLVAIGPHIQQKSFEVGLDVARELKTTAMRAGLTDLSKIIVEHDHDFKKRYVDLAAIVHAQLKFFQIPETAIDHVGHIDTLTSLQWSSYRRNGANAGRNLSFVAIAFGNESDHVSMRYEPRK